LGIERTLSRLSHADIIVWIWSADVIESAVWPKSVKPDVVVRNKGDLADQQPGLNRNGSLGTKEMTISTITNAGIPELLDHIGQLAKTRYGGAESAIVVRARQKSAVEESIRHLNDSVKHDLRQLELAAEDLRKAAAALGRVTGRIDVEELLGAIFSEFCIGK
jgi:tRNA modification GTPase